MKVARDRKSSVLASNAVHHRVDSLTGIVTLAAILGANFLSNAAWLDPVGGLFISLLVIRAGWGNTISALYELADAGLDDEVKRSVRRQATKGLAGVSEGHEVEVRDVSGVKSGQNYLIDVELAVPSMWTVEDVREVEDAVRTQVGAKVRGARRVRVRFVPRDEAEEATTDQDDDESDESDDERRAKKARVPAAGAGKRAFDEFIPGDVSPKSSPEPSDDEDHDHHDHDGHHHKSH